MNQTYLIIGILSYLIGTFAPAYFIIKFLKIGDLRNLGTGNIGAMNSYDVTGKKWVGFLAFALDFLKGALAVWIGKKIGYNYYPYFAFAAVMVIIGHNYNIFLKFRGGRGLAAAAGASLLIDPFVIIIWAVLWLTVYNIIEKNIHIANIIAILLTPLLVYHAPDDVIFYLRTSDFWVSSDYKILVAIICFILLLRHIKPMIDYFKEWKSEVSKK
jgi:glycerol-3-phosphate acyltransferase PlsY